MSRFEDDRIFATWTIIDAGEFGENLSAGIEALESAFFRSNVVANAERRPRIRPRREGARAHT